MTAAQPPKPTGRKVAARKLGTPSLRKLARAHTEAALQVLAEVATKGNSEASRISAAMALLDRGYGKSGTGVAGEGVTRNPTLYRRIELVDGTEEKSGKDHSTSSKQGTDSKS